MENNEKKEILMKNNKMIKAKYNLNPIENKVFQLILFNLQKYNNNTMKAIIPKKEITRILNKDSYKTIDGIKRILLKLFKSEIYIITKKDWSIYTFITKAHYNSDDDVFEIEMHKDVYELLTDYMKGYTPVNLEIFFKLKSFYSQRLLELLRLWSNTKNKITYSVDELRELYMLNDKYVEYKNFKSRVITPAVKELNEKALMQVDIKENKINKKVVSIDFIVTDNDKRVYFADKEDKDEVATTITKTATKKKNKTTDYKKKELNFRNFDERTYDYDELERGLLGFPEKAE